MADNLRRRACGVCCGSYRNAHLRPRGLIGHVIRRRLLTPEIGQALDVLETRVLVLEKSRLIANVRGLKRHLQPFGIRLRSASQDSEEH